MNQCPVSHLPVIEKDRWNVSHPKAGYTTIFKGIGTNIIYAGVQADSEGVVLDSIDKNMFQQVIEEMGMKETPVFTIVNLENVNGISYTYKKDFVNIAYNWGPQFRLLVICNADISVRNVVDTFIAVTPDSLPIRCAGSYEEGISMIFDCMNAQNGTSIARGEEDAQDTTYDYKKEFLASLARMSWFKLFSYPIRLPEKDHELYPYMKALACLQEDLQARDDLHKQQTKKLRQDYDQKILEKNILLNAQQELNNSLKQQLESEKNTLTNEVAAKDMELIRVSTAIAEKTIRLKELCARLSTMDIDDELKKKMTCSCQKLIATEENEKRFESCLDEIESSFLSRLQQKHPDLNQRELRLCLLIKNNIHTREIAASIGITPRGVESIRYRLHKKLKLSRHESIKNYLARTATLLR